MGLFSLRDSVPSEREGENWPVDPTKELIMHGKEKSGCEIVASSVAVFGGEGEVKQACVCVCVCVCNSRAFCNRPWLVLSVPRQHPVSNPDRADPVTFSGASLGSGGQKSKIKVLSARLVPSWGAQREKSQAGVSPAPPALGPSPRTTS